MSVNYTEPVFYSDTLGREIEVEWAVDIIQSTTNTSLRKNLFLELHQHLLDYECPKLRRVLAALNAKFGHKRYDKPPTLPYIPQPGVDLPNDIFHTRIHDAMHREDVDIDLRLLQLWIKQYFLPLCKYQYSWFALWRFFADKRVMKNDKISCFCEQMDMWLFSPDSADKRRPRKNSVWSYNGYLSETPYNQWNEQDFERMRREKQTIDGFKHLHSICIDLAGKWYVSRIKVKED